MFELHITRYHQCLELELGDVVHFRQNEHLMEENRIVAFGYHIESCLT